MHRGAFIFGEIQHLDHFPASRMLDSTRISALSHDTAFWVRQAVLANPSDFSLFTVTGPVISSVPAILNSTLAVGQLQSPKGALDTYFLRDFAFGVGNNVC